MDVKDSKGDEKEYPLPPLRQDIKIFPGPNEADGSPTYNLYDPVRAQYFKISWTEMVILKNLRPGITLSQITESINNTSTIKVTEEEVKNFFLDASRNNILASRRASEQVLKEAELRRTNIFVWLIYHYLYIRVPLINPDQFLARTLKYVMPFVSWYAFAIYIIVAIVGVMLLVSQFSQFIGTFEYFFSIQGIVIYGLGITVVKTIHEFAHAYTAKYYKLHVPTMGAAFIVLWLVLYTDVTDGWKLKKRSQRLAISVAGIIAEIIIAGFTTLGWSLTEPGMLQSLFFVISSVTWISTLVINLNPAMRFDGYYIMCDLSGIDNLQQRSFAFTRWQLRKWLLGLEVPCPEEYVTPQRRFGLMIYALYTWLYRLFLYTAIAIFVYFQFTKALGILLFFIEIGAFILIPILSEAKQLKLLYPYLKINLRFITTLSVLALILLWLVTPYPHREMFPAITVPQQNQIVYVPNNSYVKKLYVKQGDHVTSGQIIMELDSPVLDLAIKDMDAKAQILTAEKDVLSLDPKGVPFLLEKEAELASTKAKIKGLLEEKKTLTIKADFTGTVYEFDQLVNEGQFVQKDQIVGKIGNLNNIQVLAFVPELYLHDLKIGQDTSFRVKSNFEKIDGKIKLIRYDREAVLNYPQLASVNGGELPVMEEQKNQSFKEAEIAKLNLVESYFPVEVNLDNQVQGLRLGETGDIIVESPWRSLFVRGVRYAQSIFYRESGF